MRATEGLRDGSATATTSAGRRAARASAPSLLLAGNRALARVLGDNARRPTTACRSTAVLLRSEVDGAPVAGGLIGSIVRGIQDTVATATAIASGQISGSVGREGKNNPLDVAVVRELLRAAGHTDPDLGTAIERYQREVAGLRRPDGRVDPGGRTLTALRGGGGASAVGPDADDAGGTTNPAGTTHPSPTRPGGTKPTRPPDGPADSADPTRIAAEIAALATTSAGLKRSGTEETGAGRDALVARIAEIRTMIANLSDETAKVGFYHQLNAISPSYTQGTNMNLLEGPAADKTRTCNITSLAMTLEGLGKSPADFTGNKEAVRAAARVYGHVVAAAVDHADAELGSLRMPDFVQLAAIAEELGKTAIDDKTIKTAAIGSQPDKQGKKEVKGAWNSILSIYFLGRLARRFGVNADVVIFNLTSNDPTDSKQRKKHANDDFSALRALGSKPRGKKKTRRGHVEKIVDLRNKREELAALPASSTKRRAKLEREIAKVAVTVDAMTDLSQAALDEDEKSIPMREYQERVRATIGAQVDRGAQVVVGLSGHYVRLQSLGDDHIIVDDPGRSARANRKVTWEEARAMSYFASALVVSG